MAAPPLIEIDKVRKTFDGGRTFAVAHVTLPVESGVFLAVVGSSGSGKTTMLKFINRTAARSGSTAPLSPPPMRRPCDGASAMSSKGSASSRI
jgi:ABC-type phosphate/phosphonate transport system ATPase subunit